MKKILAILAVVALFACLGGLNVFADTIVLDDTNPTGTSERDVVVNVKDADGNIIDDTTEETGTEKVYSVDVAWESMTFVFAADQNVEDLVWDPVTHSYSNLTGNWEDDTAVVTVSNHSNATVDVAAAFTDGSVSYEKLGVTATIAGTDGTLDSAVGTAVADAPSMTYDVTVSGEPTQLSEFVVETVVVTLSK